MMFDLRKRADSNNSMSRRSPFFPVFWVGVFSNGLLHRFAHVGRSKHVVRWRRLLACRSGVTCHPGTDMMSWGWSHRLLLTVPPTDLFVGGRFREAGMRFRGTIPVLGVSYGRPFKQESRTAKIVFEDRRRRTKSPQPARVALAWSFRSHRISATTIGHRNPTP
ncbi:hypothetical protein VUR80DRAFT_7759 [Thermomyces stellatus]